MLVSSALLVGNLASKGFEHKGQRQPSQPRGQLHCTASCLAVVAAGFPSGLQVTLDAQSALESTLSCSPPSTYTRTDSITYRLTVPSTCLAAAKTRRKKGRRGGGGDDEIPDAGDGGSGGFGGSGGDDFGDGGSWWDDSDSQGKRGLLLQDIVLLWSIFCAFCFCHTLQHIVRQSAPRTPSSGLAAISVAHGKYNSDAAS